LKEDFGLGIPNIQNSYLQNGNNKQQPMNRNETTTPRLTGEWERTEAQPLACKLQQHVQLRMQDPNPANL
jgi:hypothetical protein